MNAKRFNIHDGAPKVIKMEPLRDRIQLFYYITAKNVCEEECGGHSGHGVLEIVGAIIKAINGLSWSPGYSWSRPARRKQQNLCSCEPDYPPDLLLA
jgi:hypothetical protein